MRSRFRTTWPGLSDLDDPSLDHRLAVRTAACCAAVRLLEDRSHVMKESGHVRKLIEGRGLKSGILDLLDLVDLLVARGMHFYIHPEFT